MSHTRTVPSIDALSSHRQSLLTVRSVMRSVWPRNRRTMVVACSSVTTQLAGALSGCEWDMDVLQNISCRSSCRTLLQ